MYDRPALQYGLFHAHAQPNKILNAVTTGISFKGVMMDIGHGRHIRWVKDTGIDVQASATTNAMDAARTRWASYNKMRGQYASTREHAVIEKYINKATDCTEISGIGWQATTDKCARAVSAIKLLEVAG